MIIGLLFILIGSGIVLFINKSKHDSLIPNGKIIFDDLYGEPHSFYSKKYPLVGKPDIIIKKTGKYIPVEIKTGLHHIPKPHHIMQLIAYCQLVKEELNKSSPYGYLLYSDTNKRFKIKFGQSEKKRLKRSIQQINEIINQGQIYRNHQSKKKCAHCNIKNYCTYKIK